ncbi:cytochrome P450 [Amycolatopsis samaneae]|uniref:Cytochrome P450 n=1 Tax=Amycolatopsis samaneae TaxID=664691 RepID=A0ABW5GL27_9PSEU
MTTTTDTLSHPCDTPPCREPLDGSRLRTLVAKVFTARRIEALRPRVRALAGAVLDEMIAGGAPADLVENFALPFPVVVGCELLGVPEGDRPLLRVWSDVVLSTSALTAEEFQAGIGELRAYLATLITQRRTAPADDLLTALIEARDGHDRLSEPELASVALAVLAGGHETTATRIAGFVHALLARPDRFAELRADPARVPAVVEELLRRFAFGQGVGYCAGAELARVELQEAFGALVTKMPRLRPAGEVVWKTRPLVRSPETLPVAW